MTGASPLQGNPLFLAADAGGKRLSCNEAPCRSSTMQPHEPDAAQAALCTCKTPRRTEFTDSRSRVPTNFPLPRTNAPCPAKHRLPATGAAVPQGRTRFPPQSIQPHLPFPFAHRVLPRRKTPEHADMFRQYRPCDFQTGFIGERKTKAPQAAQGCAARRALNDERLLKRSLSKDNLGIGLLSHVKMRSIMGDEALNFRVRNGIGCTRFSMDTKEIRPNI